VTAAACLMKPAYVFAERREIDQMRAASALYH
jgi:hypothetical protein